LEFLSQYGLFLAQAVTIVVAILVVVGFVVAMSVKPRHAAEQGHIEVRNLNRRYDDMEHTMQEAVLDEPALKALHKKQKKDDKQKHKQEQKAQKEGSSERRKRVFVLRFNGDVKAEQVSRLREEVTAVLTIAEAGKDEVLVDIESPGGMVHAYGFAASQLQRIRAAGITLTISVDKVAASGGYMMACIGEKILAAPFAIVGSIGVMANVPNFHRLLKKYDVDYDVMTAGEYKATVSMFGENTEKGKIKFRQELEETHVLFKQFVAKHRPQLVVEEIATGEIWYGSQALERKLIDEVIDSDSYLLGLRRDADLFEVQFVEKKSIQQRLGLLVQHGVSSAISSLMREDRQQQLLK
jgi:serine protease SohB